MNDMDRRDFLTGLLGGVTLVSGFSFPRVAEAIERFAPAAVPSAVVLRRNIYCLTTNSPDIVAYRAAITVMKSRPATDPTSWLAQANIHGAFNAPGGMIANACEHGSLFFLSWHRVYLYYFEQIIRAASGNANFALPYWGYTPTGARDLPAMFRDAATIPELFVSQRNNTINNGASLSASAVDPGAALAQLSFGGSGGFSRSLEGTPHGVVHGGVGGGMGAFETAGQDPIFWLHHANVDRLWEVWLATGGGRANPTDAAWLNQSWNFYDGNGAVVSMTGAQVLDTAAQLNYRYAGSACLRLPRVPRDVYTRFPWLDPRIIEMLRRVKVRAPLPGPVPPLAQQARIPLGSRLVDVRLPVDAEGQRELRRFPTREGRGNQLALVFEDIRMDAPPSIYYEVYVNLVGPAGDVRYTSPHYLGNLDFFGPSPRGPMANMPMTRSLSLLPALARLSGTRQWRVDALRVTLVPRAFTERERPEEVLGSRTQATIGRLHLRIE